MTFAAFFLIITSATLHATWNLLTKKSKASVAFYSIVSLTATCIWLHTQFWTPVKLCSMPPAFWLATLCSVASDVLYCFGLCRAYRTMEMSTAYPIMRSLPLLLTVIITSCFGIGSPLTLTAVAGIVIVFAGCMMIPLAKFSDFRLSYYFDRKMLFIFFVACGTTGYTIFDSMAQKIMLANVDGVSKTVVSLTYYTTRGVLLAIALWSYLLSSKEERGNIRSLISQRNWTPLFAGIAAGFTYILVLIAMNYVTNVSYVQVFRQIGLIIGMSFGIIFLKEKCTATKVVGVTFILFGLAMTVLK